MGEAAIHVVRPGLLTTVQDLGRWGYQAAGVPVAGPMDTFSHRLANLLVGNPSDTAALEIAYQGPTLVVEADSVRIACVGAAAPIELGGRARAGRRRLGLLESVKLTRGEELHIGALQGGAVLYLAVAGGFDVPPVLGSRSTLVRAGIGGLGAGRLHLQRQRRTRGRQRLRARRRLQLRSEAQHRRRAAAGRRDS